MRAINVFSPTFDEFDGYGRVALGIGSCFRSEGFHVNEITKGGSPNPIRPTFGGVYLGYPTSFDGYGPMASRGPKIAFTMFESTILPHGWVDSLNRCDLVIVPSQWCKNTFAENGVSTPIHVIPLWTDNAFRFIERKWEPPFRFLTIGDRWHRKGWEVALSSFYKLFGEDENFQIVLKARGDKFFKPFLNRNARVVLKDMSDEELAELYGSCHFMLFPSKGEGFGLPPREFAATGGIAIATNWGGLSDNISSWGVPIHSTEKPAWKNNPDLRQCGVWGEPDQRNLEETIMSLMTLSNYDLQSMAIEFADFCETTYSIDRFKRDILKVLGEFYG